MSEERTRLWDVEHDYYCSQGNYLSREYPHDMFESVDVLLGISEDLFGPGFGDADMDFNLVFRWDWLKDDETGEEEIAIFLVFQRKGFYKSIGAPISSDPEKRDAEERALYDWLLPRWEHMRDLWAPFGGA